MKLYMKKQHGQLEDIDSAYTKCSRTFALIISSRVDEVGLRNLSRD